MAQMTDSERLEAAKKRAAEIKAAKIRKKKVIRIGIAALLLVAVIAGLVWFAGASQRPAGDRYQAVFLDNGQAFFGKLKNSNGEYLVLEKAFYTKNQDLPADATAEQKAAVANNVSLIRVGDEVYGPENSLRIRAEQVLFWQNLETDSKVSKAIDAQSKQ